MAQEELRARGYEVRGDLRITERKTGRMYIIRNWNEPEETTQ